MTEFEGGVRTAGAIFSPLLKKRGYVNKNPVHLIDWLPTFYAAAGGDLADLGKIDGVNQWEALSNNLTVNRSEILLNINDVTNTSAILSQDGRYKFLQGTRRSSLKNNHSLNS
jgi:arylsulfatase B